MAKLHIAVVHRVKSYVICILYWLANVWHQIVWCDGQVVLVQFVYRFVSLKTNLVCDMSSTRYDVHIWYINSLSQTPGWPPCDPYLLSLNAMDPRSWYFRNTLWICLRFWQWKQWSTSLTFSVCKSRFCDYFFISI